MKRIMGAALATLMFAAPLAGNAYADPPRYHGDSNWNDNSRGDDNRYDNDRNDNRRGDNHRNHRRGDDRRDNHNDSRWDSQRHNGYTYNGRWNYGPPPQAYYGRQGFQAGYQNWRRGDRLPSYYQSSYRQVDYRYSHLRAPPRGYRYVQDDRGETLLVAIATGVILSVILNNGR